MNKIRKITKEEKQLLLEKRLELIDSNARYRRDTFKTYFKDDLKVNLEAWKGFDYKEKMKIVKRIQDFEDKAILHGAFQINKANIKKSMQYISDLKHNQLVQFGIREK